MTEPHAADHPSEAESHLDAGEPTNRADRPGGSVLRAQLENGPLEGQTIEVEFVEARPPKTIEATDEQGSTTYRYCLSEWTQEGETALYTFLYAV